MQTDDSYMPDDAAAKLMFAEQKPQGKIYGRQTLQTEAQIK